MNVDNELIKQLRVEKGWTQQQLSEVSDLSIRTVQRVEKLGVASIESVNALCSVLNTERSKLLTEDDSASLRSASVTISLRKKVSYLFVFIIGIFIGGAFVTWVA